MQLTEKDMTSLCRVAVLAVREAGQLVHIYSERGFSVTKKTAGTTPESQALTEVDFLSQDILLKHLLPTLEEYDLGLLTEEMEDDGSRLKKDYFWCIDPLDGTLPFVEARPGYAVSVALVSQRGNPCVGAVYDPTTQTLYHAAKGAGVFKNEEPWVLKPLSNTSYETVASGGAVMNAMWAIERAPACFYKKPKAERGGGCAWDYSATACIYSELGAWVSDMKGKPLDLNREESTYMNHSGVLFASSETIAREILD